MDARVQWAEAMAASTPSANDAALLVQTAAEAPASQQAAADAAHVSILSSLKGSGTPQQQLSFRRRGPCEVLAHLSGRSHSSAGKRLIAVVAL
jgi:hypothetical protein